LADLPKLDRLRVVLVRTRNPLNIGAAARAMSNFGFSRLRVVNPYPVAFREARSAVGAAGLLAKAEEYENVADAVADCSLVVGTTALGHRAPQHPLRRLDEGAQIIRQRLRSGRVALLFGSEKVGLSNHDLSHSHWLIRIPTRPQHGSMNLAQAVAVCLYELVRDARTSRQSAEKKRAAKAGDLNRITAVLLDLLQASGYVKEGAAAAMEQKLRRFVWRFGLSSADAGVWLGMLRQILWKVRSREDSFRSL
jgi:TrmH family RNA methyltransferase